MRQERRLHQRYRVGWELRGKVLMGIEPAGALPDPADPTIRGEVSDIGGGGLCLVSRDKADPASAVRCEIFAPQIPVGIPTLLQVRWVHEHGDGLTYKLGLQFLV